MYKHTAYSKLETNQNPSVSDPDCRNRSWLLAMGKRNVPVSTLFLNIPLLLRRFFFKKDKFTFCNITPIFRVLHFTDAPAPPPPSLTASRGSSPSCQLSQSVKDVAVRGSTGHVIHSQCFVNQKTTRSDGLCGCWLVFLNELPWRC